MLIRCVLFFFLSFVWLNQDATALTVSPLSLELGTTGSKASGSLTVRNDRDRKTPVSIQVLRFDRETSKLVPGDDLLLAFPPQAVLEPGSSQAIRFQWLGDPEMKSSEAFYAVVQEVPVELEPKSKAGVGAPVETVLDVVVALRIAVLVSPEGAAADLKVDDVQNVRTTDGLDFITITVRNDGTKHGRLGQKELVLTSGDGRKAVLGSPDFPAPGGAMRMLVLPGMKRAVSIPIPDKGWASGVTAEIR